MIPESESIVHYFEVPLVAKQHRGDQIGGIGRVFGEVIGRGGLYLVHRDTICSGTDKEIRSGRTS